MGKKKRGSAKTGDQALYKSRSPQKSHNDDNDNDDDFMHNPVDRFHKNIEQEEYLRFAKDNNDSEDEVISGHEGVMDLGVSVDDDDSSSSSEDDDSSKGNSKDQGSIQEDEEELSVSSDSEQEEEEDVLDWGRSKASYYHGDTADLEIGQDEEDAMVEEEAAKQVLQSRYEDMDEDDFMFQTTAKSSPANVASKITKTAPNNRRQLLKKAQSHHPELLPLLKHFSQVVQEYMEETRIVTNALLTDNQDNQDTREAIGATPMGLRYIVTKSALQASVALNVASYLLLKTQEENDEFLLQKEETTNNNNNSIIESHPVLARLQDYNKLMIKLQTRVEDKVETLPEQVSSLVKAAALMQQEEDDEETSQEEDHQEESIMLQNVEKKGHKNAVDEEDTLPPTTVSTSSDNDSHDEDEQVAQGVLNEARFGLRAAEVGASSKKKSNKKRSSSDFGDDEYNDFDDKRATRSLASTINAIEQRSETRKRRAAPSSAIEKVDYDNDEQHEAMNSGLEMMQAEGLFDSDNDDKVDTESSAAPSDNDDNDFYQSVKKKSRSKKNFKKNLYKVAPKYPSVPHEVEGERAIGRAIFKNRGLVAHKSKLNRNPRVKKREQYRKALIRRKGTVREVRTDEAQKYGGEETGIKSGLSRSRKLGVR